MRDRTRRRQPAASADADAVRRLFDSTVDHWDLVYDTDTPEGVIYRRRQQAALQMARQAAGPGGGTALDLGCGAGGMAAALGLDGWSVDAVDVSPEMVERARLRVARHGLEGRVTVSTGDVHHLDGAPSRYDLCVALGVLPWLEDQLGALRELARVTKPGGWLVLTADNRLRVTHLLDPVENPALGPLRRLVGRALLHTVHRGSLAAPSPAVPPRERRSTRRQVDRMLRRSGFDPVHRRTVGFWPFTFFNRPLLGAAQAKRVDERLQRWADRGLPVVRSAGNHYVVLARCRASSDDGRRRGCPKASE